MKQMFKHILYDMHLCLIHRERITLLHVDMEDPSAETGPQVWPAAYLAARRLLLEGVRGKTVASSAL